MPQSSDTRISCAKPLDVRSEIDAPRVHCPFKKSLASFLPVLVEI